MNELPTEVTVETQARAAGRGTIKPVGSEPDIDAFRDGTRAFINAQPAGRARSLAHTKLDELVFWLRETRNQ